MQKWFKMPRVLRGAARGGKPMTGTAAALPGEGKGMTRKARVPSRRPRLAGIVKTGRRSNRVASAAASTPPLLQLTCGPGVRERITVPWAHRVRLPGRGLSVATARSQGRANPIRKGAKTWSWGGRLTRNDTMYQELLSFLSQD
jgi:hypothetical protein